MKYKERYKKRRVVTKSIIAIIFVLLSLITVYLLYLFNIIPHKAYTNADFNITTYISNVDKDSDGIDDQTDMLDATRKYIATKPQYKSKYYGETGYPDDEFGVCTDVVAFAMRDAGYDLMELVNKDVVENPDAYPTIERPDKMIDFRRVRNLKYFFKRNFISLTTDPSDIVEWQGGDIVIFEGHIAVVSDKRNRNGVTFVIHNAYPGQPSYEEDILEMRDDIVGHYRLS